MIIVVSFSACNKHLLWRHAFANKHTHTYTRPDLDLNRCHVKIPNSFWSMTKIYIELHTSSIQATDLCLADIGSQKLLNYIQNHRTETFDISTNKFINPVNAEFNATGIYSKLSTDINFNDTKFIIFCTCMYCI